MMIIIIFTLMFQLVYDMLVRMRKEMGSEEPTVTPEIDTLILIDRYPRLILKTIRYFKYSE